MVSVSGILNTAKTVYKYGKTVLKATPELTFGTSADKVAKVLRNANAQGKSISETAKLGFQAVEKAGKGNFFKKMGQNLIKLVPDLSRYTKAGVRLAGIKGTSKIAGAFKGLAKGIGKKLPFVFAAMMLLGEVPNIVKATKEKGIVQGIKETIKPVARLAGAGIGSVIGTAIWPAGGGIVGWIAGEWLAGKLVGKSYSEKEEEKKEQEQETIAKLQQQGLLNPQVNPQDPTPVNPLQPQDPVTNPAQNPFAYPGGAYTPFGPMNPSSVSYADDLMIQKMPFNAVC